MTNYPQTYDELRKWLQVSLLDSRVDGLEFMNKESGLYWKQVCGFRYYYYIIGIYSQKIALI